jgi:hypothetical protein
MNNLFVLKMRELHSEIKTSSCCYDPKQSDTLVMTQRGSVIGTKCTTRDGGPSGQLVQLERGHFATLLFMNVQEFIGTCPTYRRWSYGARRLSFAVGVIKGNETEKGLL